MRSTPDEPSLAAALASVGEAVRDAVLAVPRSASDAGVVREAGGDVVFGVDARADEALLAALDDHCGERWPGRLVVEGFDDPQPVGGGDGPWTYLADPVDGTRPWLAGKRSAWVLLGAGRGAVTLAGLTTGAAVEVPTSAGLPSRVAWASIAEGSDGRPRRRLDVRDGATPVELRPLAGAALDRRFVTVARFAAGHKAAIGAWEDELLAGLETYEDPWLCTGGLLMGLASGMDAAVLDPRPLFGVGMCAHPYDLAAVVVARAAGVIVEALPPGPLDVPLDPTADVAWAGYANEAIADELRRRLPPGPTPRR